MDEEALFEMVNEAVMYAKDQLEKGEELAPFAMVLYDNGTIQSLNSEESDFDARYESLVNQLRKKIKEEPEISALSIVTRVAIPEQYHAATSNGIRVHLEERDKRGDKIGARFLYVPYQLYQNSETSDLTVQLYTPIPVSFPPEIFV